ncbi:MAG: cupin [Litorimonas sp.]
MTITDVKNFKAMKAWGAKDIAEIEGATVRLHWTDEPYIWHVNDGPEVFVVLDGKVDMHYKVDGQIKVVKLLPSDIFYAQEGDEHVAHPLGEARILVIER